MKSKCVNNGVPQVEDSSLINNSKILSSLKIFCTFARPFASIGVIVNVASISLTTIERLSDISPPFIIGLLKVAAAFSCILAYANGVNQIFDIEIDKINKPYLPLASGQMTIQTGISIASFFALMALAIGINIGSTTLFWGLFLSFLLLTGYSVELPFLRWKSSAIGAATSLATNFGLVLPLSTYLHMQTNVFGRQANFPNSFTFGISGLTLFYAVLAIYKDVPDLEGDKKFGINSFAARLGQEKMFWICVYILEMFYAIAIVVGATFSYPWSKLISVLGHGVLSLILWNQAKSTDLKDQTALSAFYGFIWKLIYAECAMVAVLR